MSRRPADAATRARLEALRAIARMQADAALARLAISARGRARLLHALDALGRAEEPLAPAAPLSAQPPRDATGDAATDSAVDQFGEVDDPAMVQARLAHARWIDAQRRMLNQRLALIQAEYLTQRPQAQRAFGRAEVLDRLRTELAVKARQAAAKREGIS